MSCVGWLRPVSTRWGDFTLVATPDEAGHPFLKGLLLPGQRRPDWPIDAHLAPGCVAQIEAYAAGTRTTFDPETFGAPWRCQGTPFQERVWQALRAIPYGSTCSYADIARAIDHPRSVRAVGAANRVNPWPLVIPCHRVIASSGALQGYAGGLTLKADLLAWEHQVCATPSPV